MSFSSLTLRSLLTVATAIVTLLGTTLAMGGDMQIQPRISVVGEGSAALAPDLASVTLSVTREAATAREALDANSEAMAAVMDAMRKEGIADKDLQTSNFSITPKYNQASNRSSGERTPPTIRGYQVRNSLTVRVRDLSKLGAIIDTSVSLGVNEGGRIQFGNQDSSPALEKARTAAVKDATERAKTLAQAAGVKLGKLLEITEDSQMAQPMPMVRAEMAMARPADAVPVAAGENNYSVSVRLSFAIEQE